MVSRKLYSPDATHQHDDEDNEDDDPRRIALCHPGQSKNEQLNGSTPTRLMEQRDDGMKRSMGRDCGGCTRRPQR
jgi:hypothetical protein